MGEVGENMSSPKQNTVILSAQKLGLCGCLRDTLHPRLSYGILSVSVLRLSMPGPIERFVAVHQANRQVLPQQALLKSGMISLLVGYGAQDPQRHSWDTNRAASFARRRIRMPRRMRTPRTLLPTPERRRASNGYNMGMNPLADIYVGICVRACLRTLRKELYRQFPPRMGECQLLAHLFCFPKTRPILQPQHHEGFGNDFFEQNWGERRLMSHTFVRVSTGAALGGHHWLYIIKLWPRTLIYVYVLRLYSNRSNIYRHLPRHGVWQPLTCPSDAEFLGTRHRTGRSA